VHERNARRAPRRDGADASARHQRVHCGDGLARSSKCRTAAGSWGCTRWRTRS
jgi:hypothetical protein